MPAARSTAARGGPAVLAIGLTGVGFAQLLGGAPVAAAIAACTWAVGRSPARAAPSGRAAVTICCAAIALVAICAQLDLASRAASPAWRGLLLADIFIGAGLLGGLAREVLRR